MFQLQTIVTTECNLRCQYCYIKNRTKKNNAFTLQDFDTAITFLPEIKSAIEKYNYRSDKSTIAFFGGEPLLNFPFIKDVAVKYTNYIKTLPTNGYLLPKYLKELQELQVSVNVSYDGPYNIERITTKLYNNQFPFNELLPFMQKNSPKVMIGNYNVKCMSDNFNFFLQHDIYYPDFSIVRDDIWSKEDLKIYSIQLEFIDKIVDKFFNETGTVPVIGLYKLYLCDMILSHTQGKRPFTCFSGTGGVSISANGDIYPCARFASNKKCKLGNYKEQVLNESLIKDFSEIFNPLTNTYCTNCSIRTECNMGCNYSQFKNGNFKESKPILSVCELFKITYEHACNFYIKYKNEITDYLNHSMKN